MFKLPGPLIGPATAATELLRVDGAGRAGIDDKCIYGVVGRGNLQCAAGSKCVRPRPGLVTNKPAPFEHRSSRIADRSAQDQRARADLGQSAAAVDDTGKSRAVVIAAHTQRHGRGLALLRVKAPDPCNPPKVALLSRPKLEPPAAAVVERAPREHSRRWPRAACRRKPASCRVVVGGQEEQRAGADLLKTSGPERRRRSACCLRVENNIASRRAEDDGHTARKVDAAWNVPPLKLNIAVPWPWLKPERLSKPPLRL